MGTGNIRVLVVDDSAVIREMISDFIDEAPGLEVAGLARDGVDAVKMFQEVNPDVVTLDIQMPKKDGLETLDDILNLRPVPVIMVSSLTQLGADITLNALERGALDYVSKPEDLAGVEKLLKDELLRKIRAMAGTDVERMLQIRRDRANRRSQQPATIPATNVTSGVSPSIDLSNKCIAIGISTGGPPALTTMFQSLQSPLPPIVIVQHMPANFTNAFAWRLDSHSKINVKEAASGDILKPDHAYIAPGGRHLHLVKQGSQTKVVIRDGEHVSSHRPSVDVMMKCAAEIYGDRCLGLVMTGMGRDGSDGCRDIRQAGGYVFGQNETSSDVYGMNKTAFVEGNVDRQFDLDEVVGLISLQIKRLWGREAVGASG